MFVLVLCASTFVRAQFEGVIDFQHTIGSGESARKTPVSVFIKNTMMAINSKEGDERAEGKVIYRGDKQVLWIIDDVKKEYLEIDVTENKQSGEREDSESAENDEPKLSVRKTGKTETILGYTCKEVILENENESHDVWGTEKLGNIFEGVAKAFGSMSGKQSHENTNDWRTELMKMNLFPLKAVSMENGTVTETEEVTGIEKKSLSASLFAAPEGYEKHSMDPEMGKMMQQMQGQMKKHKKGSDKGEQHIDMEKMMKEMQEKFKDIKKDTTEDKDNE